MTESQNNTQNNSPAFPQNQREIDVYEDQINLADYFFVLWKHRYLILFGSIIPAVIAGAFLLLTPRNYKATYTYKYSGTPSQSLSEQSYKLFLEVFHGQENADKMTAKLPDFSPHGVGFEVWPPYSEEQTIPQLLYMSLVDKSKEVLNNKCAILRDNFENVMPLYFIEQELAQSLSEYRSKLASFEREKFNVKLSLERNNNTLAQLKKVTSNDSKQNQGDITLQFDIGGKTEYLPLGYQIQAAESGIVKLQEEIDTNEKLYIYHKKLFDINSKMLEYLKSNSANYNIGDFHAFLTGLAKKAGSIEQKDYLNSYIKTIENRISANVPATAQPEITALPKGMVKKSGIVFVIALMLSVFAGFLMEGLQKRTA